MIPQVEIKIDEAKVNRIRQAVAGHEKGLPKIMYRSLKKTASRGRTQIDRDVRSVLTVKKKDVMNRIVDIEKASYTHWVWRLGISLKRITLAAFGNVSKNKQGLGYTIRRGLRRTALHAFVSKGFTHWRSGEYIESKTVWRRAGMAGGKLVPRGPLIVLRGPSIGFHVATGPILSNVERDGLNVLSNEIDGQVKRELAARMPK